VRNEDRGETEKYEAQNKQGFETTMRKIPNPRGAIDRQAAVEMLDTLAQQLLIELAKAARKIAGDDEILHDIALGELLSVFDKAAASVLLIRSQCTETFSN
jgi:hypothetical protein